MEQLTNIEQAKALKELGFDWETFRCYELDGLLVKSSGYNHNKTKDYISAPTVSHALDWCREEKGIVCSVEIQTVYHIPDIEEFIGYSWIYLSKSKYNNLIKSSPEDDFKTHPEASSALLTAILEYLKEQSIGV